MAGHIPTESGLSAYGELRVRTGSIWPGAALHSMSNAVVTPLIVNGHLRFDGHADVLFSPVPASIMTMLLFGATWLLLTSRRGARTPEHAGV